MSKLYHRLKGIEVILWTHVNCEKKPNCAWTCVECCLIDGYTASHYFIIINWHIYMYCNFRKDNPVDGTFRCIY